MGLVVELWLSPAEKFKRIQSFKKWKDKFGGAVLSEPVREACEECMALINSREVTEIFVSRLATLAAYARPEEIFANMQLLSETNGKFGNSLSHLILRYGEKEGTKRFNKHKKVYSSNGKKGTFGIDYWMAKGYTENEARDIVRSRSANASKVRYNKYTPEENSLMLRKSNPLSLLYWTSRGYTAEEAEIQRKPFLMSCAGSIEGFIHRHGPIFGPIKYEESKVKRENTVLERYGGMSKRMGLNRGASEWSRTVLDQVAEFCDQNNLRYYYGVPGNQEWWCRSPENPNKYYFYDFAVPSLDVIIEYNGVNWHPKSKESFEVHGVLKDKYDELVTYDRNKIEAAISRGFDVLVVWSDDLTEDNIKQCISFLQDKME